ncbi:TRAP transporter substrate-binding protein [Petroclostridium sp. X23]|uniref:TRAP transporter substrate-binding protein n=1 Tax=Petroclostridium sp. X23 TaxID=3045146 RepID=UPI0024ADE052|nr:TRAP transporter substrate-binding protein [Petroclostridium sp. X23]WHH60903.1 TRAP transporter substrate-binding protein [Petroclostridium sp. X23]
MKRKGIALILVLTLILSLSLAGCGTKQMTNEETKQPASEGSKDTAKESTKKPIVLRLGHHVSETHSTNREFIEKFIELVNEKSGGNITVENYPNGQLGGQRELLEALELGSLDMSYADLGMFANYDLAIGILDLPFIFDDIDHGQRALDSGVEAMIQKKIEQASKIKTLSIIPVAFRSTLLATKTITSLEDFKGVKVRTPESPVLIETFKALGATPTAIPSGEAYTAIQTGVVDGMEGHKEFLHSIKVYEVAKKWTETKHNLTFNTINISQKVFNELPQDAQTILVEAAKDAAKHFYKANKEIDAQFKKEMEAEGVVFNDIDLNELRKATENMVNTFITKNNAQDIYDAVNEAR